MTINCKTMLVALENIKTKYNYASETAFKIGAKSVFRSMDKKLAAYYIIGFVNWKRKIKAYTNSNQVIQTQNQSLFSNVNLRLSKPNIALALGNKLVLPITKCFNYIGTSHYSQNCPNLKHRNSQTLENVKV